MEINVAQFLKEPVGAVREYDIEGTTEEGYPVKGKVQLVRTNRSILVMGKVTTTVRSVCSRCLEPFDDPLSVQIEEEFFPTTDVVTGRPLSAPPEPDAFTIDENHTLDLTEAVRQYTIMATPMKPVCKPDCKGFCPQCGRNVNYGPCECPQETSDPRWSKLQVLLSGRKNPKEE